MIATRVTRVLRCITALAGIALLTSARLSAQQPLTLDGALRIAHENSPAFRRVANDAAVADAAVRRSFGALLPSISADLRFTGYSSSRVTGEDDFGKPVALPAAIDFNGSSADQGVGLNMTLFDGGAAFREIGAARAAAAATTARISAEAARLTGDVTRQYYAALRAARLIEVERRLLASAQDRLDRTEQLLRVAGSSPVDVLGARAAVASQQQQVARAQNEARKQALLLNELIGRAGAADFVLASDIPAAIDPASLPRAELIAAALRASPAILEADATARASDRRASSARAARFPTISANASYARSMSLSSYDALFELNPQNHALSFGVGVSIPLFNNFRTSLQIAQAADAADDAKQGAIESRLRVEREVRSALLDLDNSYVLLTLAQSKAAISRERLELAQEQYRNGAMSFTELQNVIDRTADAERDVVDASFAYAVAATFVEEYTATSLRDPEH